MRHFAVGKWVKWNFPEIAIDQIRGMVITIHRYSHSTNLMKVNFSEMCLWPSCLSFTRLLSLRRSPNHFYNRSLTQPFHLYLIISNSDRPLLGPKDVSKKWPLNESKCFVGSRTFGQKTDGWRTVQPIWDRSGPLCQLFTLSNLKIRQKRGFVLNLLNIGHNCWVDKVKSWQIGTLRLR